MVATLSGKIITQSGGGINSRDTLESISSSINDATIMTKIANGVFELKSGAVLKITGFTNFSNETLIVQSNSNNFRMVGGNHIAGRDLNGQFSEGFTLIYNAGVAQGKEHSSNSNEINSVISGGSTIKYYDWVVQEKGSTGYDGFNLIDPNASIIMKGVRLLLRSQKYTNIKIKSNAILQFEEIRNTTIRDRSGVPFGISLWKGGEENSSDTVKLLGSGTISGLSVNYDNANSTIQLANANFSGGVRTFKNSFIPISRLTGHNGIVMRTETSYKLNFQRAGNSITTAKTYIKANGDGQIFVNGNKTNNDVVDIITWTGKRNGTNPGYAQANSNIVDRRDLLISAINYDSIADVKSSYTDYLGQQDIVFTLNKDENITDQDKTAVDARNTIDTAEQLYDKAKSYLVDNYKGEESTFVTRQGNTIDAGDYNIEIDKNADKNFVPSRDILLTGKVYVKDKTVNGIGTNFNNENINKGDKIKINNKEFTIDIIKNNTKISIKENYVGEIGSIDPNDANNNVTFDLFHKEEVLIIKSNTFIGNIKTTGTVTLLNGANIAGAISDSNGDSNVTATVPSGYDHSVHVFTTKANAEANNNEIANGITFRYQSESLGGKTVWFRLVKNDGSFIIQSYTIPIEAGNYKINLVVTEENSALGKISEVTDKINTMLEKIDGKEEYKYKNDSIPSLSSSGGSVTVDTEEIANKVWQHPDKTDLSSIETNIDTIDNILDGIVSNGVKLTTTERNDVAVAIETAILNEGDGQKVIDAIVQAIDNENISASVIANAVWDKQDSGEKMKEKINKIKTDSEAANKNAKTAATLSA